MIDGINPNFHAGKIGAPSAISNPVARPAFADVLESYLQEVGKPQQDASTPVEDLATGRPGDVAGVMTALDKSDIAFKTLLAIRDKLMYAYEEIKNIEL